MLSDLDGLDETDTVHLEQAKSTHNTNPRLVTLSGGGGVAGEHQGVQGNIVVQDSAMPSAIIGSKSNSNLDQVDVAKKLKHMTEDDRKFCAHISKQRAQIQKLNCFPIIRGIHKEAARRFYKLILNAGEQVMELLESGYKPQYLKPPKPAHFRNNQSALNDLPTCRKHIQDWLENGFVEQVTEAPRIINPMTLVKKIDTMTGEMKSRFCLDPSRSLNECLAPPPVKLQDLRTVTPR